MPVKTYREMSKMERRRYSLSSRVFRANMYSSLVLGLTALLVGLALYMYLLEKQYVSEGYNHCRNAASILNEVSNVPEYSAQVMEIYYGMTDEERAEVGTDAYLAKYSAVTLEKDYQAMMRVLTSFRLNSDVTDIYVAAYDKVTGALVYIADPDTIAETACPIGTWESADAKELDLFMNASSKSRPSYIYRSEQTGLSVTSGCPVGSSKMTYRVYVLADITLIDILNGMHKFTLYFGSSILVLILILSTMVTTRMKKTLVEPINRITDAAVLYTEDRKDGKHETEHFSKLNIRTGDELENLAFVMADMEQDLSLYEEHLTEVTAEKQRIDTELSLATRLQAGSLPHVYPPFPDKDEFELYASMNPAKEVGGDFYDYFLVDEDHLALVIGDVSGKGVPAALFMMVSKMIIQLYAKEQIPPSEVLRKVNDSLVKGNVEEMFVTVWLGILELSTGKMTCANAGHEYPILCQDGGAFELFRDRHGFVIGAMEDLVFTDYVITLQPGDWLFVYTDGVPEASDERNVLFGNDRTTAALNKCKPTDTKALIEQVQQEIDIFCGETPQADDITMLSLHYFGTDKGKKVTRIRRSATINQIEGIIEEIDEALENGRCPMKVMMQINIAVDEILANICSYAYRPKTGEVDVQVYVPEGCREAVITFTDNGIPYNPLEHEDPDISLSAEERSIGGLGIYLVRQTMDIVTYEYTDSHNVLTVTKKW